MITKIELDALVSEYETSDFIKNDPIQFLYKVSEDREKEIIGFIASLFAYGNRKVFIKKINEIFTKTDKDLLGFIKNGDFSILKGFEYRFAKDSDIIPIFNCLSKLYNESLGLKELFLYAKNNANIEKNMLNERFFQIIVDYFYSNAPTTVGSGFYHMIPNPKNGGAMKRMNMFLRWLVRKGPVDIGLWNFINTAELLIPLDVHVARVSRDMGLLKRKSNDFKAVIELSDKLREFSPEDPIKYDFAMFAFGIMNNK